MKDWKIQEWKVKIFFNEREENVHTLETSKTEVCKSGENYVSMMYAQQEDPWVTAGMSCLPIMEGIWSTLMCHSFSGRHSDCLPWDCRLGRHTGTIEDTVTDVFTEVCIWDVNTAHKTSPSHVLGLTKTSCADAGPHRTQESLKGCRWEH